MKRRRAKQWSQRDREGSVVLSHGEAFQRGRQQWLELNVFFLPSSLAVPTSLCFSGLRLRQRSGRESASQLKGCGFDPRLLSESRPVATGRHLRAVPPIFVWAPPNFIVSRKICFKYKMIKKSCPPKISLPPKPYNLATGLSESPYSVPLEQERSLQRPQQEEKKQAAAYR